MSLQAEAAVVNGVEQLKVNGDVVNGAPDEDQVTPWNVTSASSKGLDYEKLIGSKCVLSLTSV